MHKYWLFFSLFLVISLYIGGGVVLGADCRQEVPDTKRYINKYDCVDKNSVESLKNYCASSNTVSSWHSDLSCPNGLQCHICECQSPNKIENGVCVQQNNLKTTVTDQKSDTKTISEFATCPLEQQDSKGKCCKKYYYDTELQQTVCCEGILLNTNVPFIGQCIVFRRNADTEPNAGLILDESTAFPVLMGGLSKLMVSIILLVGFIGILIGGVMISASGGSDNGAKSGKKIIGNVISALALLGASGIILRLINPNFFG